MPGNTQRGAWPFLPAQGAVREGSAEARRPRGLRRGLPEAQRWQPAVSRALVAHRMQLSCGPWAEGQAG